MIVLNAVHGILDDLRSYLEALDNERYSSSIQLLSGATVGEHTRHVLEFFHCLLDQRLSGEINYDKRVRDHRIETDTQFTLKCLDLIAEGLQTADLDVPCALRFNYGSSESQGSTVQTTIARELIYNIEHAIHHMAIIKIGLGQVAPEIVLDPAFGVAPSTMRYRGQQANC